MARGQQIRCHGGYQRQRHTGAPGVCWHMVQCWLCIRCLVPTSRHALCCSVLYIRVNLTVSWGGTIDKRHGTLMKPALLSILAKLHDQSFLY